MRVVSLVPFVVFAVLATSAIGQEPSNEWRYFGGDEAFTRYAPFDQIDRHNVDKLELVWRRPAVDPELQRAFPDLQPNRDGAWYGCVGQSVQGLPHSR